MNTEDKACKSLLNTMVAIFFLLLVIVIVINIGSVVEKQKLIDSNHTLKESIVCSGYKVIQVWSKEHE